MPILHKEENSKNIRPNSLWVNFISGATAGFADTLLNYPPYGIKIRIQRGEIKHWREILTGKFYYPQKLYQGIIPAALSIVPATIMQDGVTGMIRSRYDSGPGAAFLGGLAGAPFSTLVANVIIRQQKYNLKPLEAMKSIQTEGWGRFFRGFIPTTKRDVSYAVGAFWAVDAIKNELPNVHPVPQAVVASLLSGGVVTFLSHPFDTVATLMQDKEKSPSKVSYLETTKNLFKEKGIRGFYPGVFFRGYSVIAGMLTLSTVSEKTKKEAYSFLSAKLMALHITLNNVNIYEQQRCST